MIGELEVLELEIMHKHGMSLKKISSSTGHSINTVRKYVRDGRPVMYNKQVLRKTKLDNYKAYLLSRISEAKPNWLPATVLFMEIKSQGYTGCLSTLRNYLQKLKPTVKVRPLVRFETEPGEQMQVDF
ncbi:MAG: IS21 family transposase, partial [Legionellaceae bacterium]|nr:IS21 family transposase [Legionellaceae bacterium]